MFRIMAVEIFYKEESYKIIGLCMRVHKNMGSGFLESVYAEILEKEFQKESIPYEREKKLELYFEGEKLKKYFKADFICYGHIILEIKSVSFLHANFSKQMRNYLKSTQKKLGLLINFGEPSLKYKRIINSAV